MRGLALPQWARAVHRAVLRCSIELGYASVAAISGNGAVRAHASVVDNATNDVTTIPLLGGD